MDKYEMVIFCTILVFVFLITYSLLNSRKPQTAEAEPGITEIPEYVMKATKCGAYICTEYTIYRITRN